MQGDANEVVDPAPYVVSDVRIVRGSLPHLATVIVWFGNPVVLGGITIAASLLVVWAFWPRQAAQEHGSESAGDRPSSAGAAEAIVESVAGARGDLVEVGRGADPVDVPAGSLRRDRRT